MTAIFTQADQLAALGLNHHQAGRLQHAAQYYQQALATQHNHLDATHLLGCLLLQVGQADKAIGLLTRAAMLAPMHPDIQANLAQCLLRLNRAAEALPPLQLAARHHPSADIDHQTGIVLEALGRRDEAELAYRQALSRQPNHVGALTNLLNLQRNAIDQTLALALAQHVTTLPTCPADLAVQAIAVLTRHDRFEEAEMVLALARQRGPHPQLPLAEALLLLEHGKPDQAVALLEQAASHVGNSVELLARLAEAYLATGQWQRGLRAFEARLHHPNFETPLPIPNVRRWRGEDISGQIIRLQAEQGLGDMIQLMRLAPALLRRGAAQVELELPQRLHRLAQSLPGVAQGQILVLNKADRQSQARFQAPILSVLAHMGISDDADIAALCPCPYLSAEPERVLHWQHWLDQVAPRQSGRVRIAVAWQGNPNFIGNHRRSIPVQMLAPLADCAMLIAVQRGPASSTGPLPPWLHDPGGDLDEGPDGFIDTAALMMGCDAVVSCCTAIAHLAGALGRPTLLALSHAPDWRWQYNRIDTPWYSTMHLFRQNTPGDWQAPIAAIGQTIQRFKQAPVNR